MKNSKRTAIAAFAAFALITQTATTRDFSAGPVKAEMIRIPGGTFTMGSNDSRDSDPDWGGSASPAHTVTLNGFSMSRYEVTQELYFSITKNRPSVYFRSNPADGEDQDKRPVENVTWYDAVEFCNRLSAAEGLTPAYTIDKDRSDPTGIIPDGVKWTVTWNKNANGYRLPTEAEWEYAAKGGNPNAAGWKKFTYSGSNNADAVGWYAGNSWAMTREAGKKAPNGLGLYDMSGNVSEWCWDWYEDYTGEARTNPNGASSGIYRVIRGGSWNQDPSRMRSVFRDFLRPDGHFSNNGFRLARSL